MSDDALIRRQRLKDLGYGPRDLANRIGSTYQYWRDLMETDKSFGEKTARNIEEKLGLPRGYLDMAGDSRLEDQVYEWLVSAPFVFSVEKLTRHSKDLPEWLQHSEGKRYIPDFVVTCNKEPKVFVEVKSANRGMDFKAFEALTLVHPSEFVFFVPGVQIPTSRFKGHAREIIEHLYEKSGMGPIPRIIAKEPNRVFHSKVMDGLEEGSPDEVRIPQFDTGGAMGDGLILRDQPGVIRGWSVNKEWLNKNLKNHTGAQNLCIVTGFGDSMKGMYNSGDPLVVDTGVKNVEFDAVYFFRVGDEGFIKRLQRIPGEGIVAISENKAYRDWTIKPDMDFEVFGRVLKAWKGEEF